ncbi:hypothetical protein ASPZODRAFT_134712 [Penicilliopsis zonata CBS 506.65]|uniref:Glutathione S-transferase kappa n=1 Tax=Penicilliopsis zonata CBS 506.65 TaxID=1073090 RepID=A0A1L9SBT0_9EURO|nr:hypothetical protein ASPZODRAFT_134712 [Penicilliopsis zonata CBS 506.65]OJJ44631.1 hypothetical protein ASPZODRAFT_134712 [Penicilliopsis zonata CBS 506.65]
MATRKITLYLDIVSPFAYIAFHVLRKSAAFSRCDITYVPIFLGGLMNMCSNTPPIQVKNKASWINKERIRWAKRCSVPIAEKTPDGFPTPTLSVQRALCAVSKRHPAHFAQTIEELYQSYWVEGNARIGQPEGFLPVLEKVLGTEVAHEVLKASNQQDTKNLLSANTGQAFKAGAFGLPWFECTNSHGETECFWGIDRLSHVADFLGLEQSWDKGFKAMM